MIENKIQKVISLLPFLTPACLLVGVIIGDPLTKLISFIPWIFAIMTFTGSTSANFKQLKNVFEHPLPIFVTLMVLHVLVPMVALSIGHAVFGDDPLTIIGFILVVVIPCGVTSFVWVSIFRGNNVLCLTTIIIDTILSPIIVPYSLLLFVGQKVDLNPFSLTLNLVTMIVIPSLLGMVFNQFAKEGTKNIVRKWSSPFKLGVLPIVLINGSVLSTYLKHIDLKVIKILVCIFIISSFGYLVSWTIGKLLKWNHEETVSLTFNGGMRNISAGSVLAVTYFPAAVVLPVVLGQLLQQVLAASFGKILFGKEKIQERVQESKTA
ncbi:bile acid:sodium symporter family protein [Terrilactibacillus laevilacticus]|uniref:Bile acid:sodium symporter family protein n=1 Tax=Terrilactibacillus laevilacticus TaxID=1380157 RepID=A0ABW5PLR0_9BACI|nr:bile acid:sodium symporter family protein [Terrilactibacillus laevilacticus]